MPKDCQATCEEAQKEENAGQVHTFFYVIGSPLPHTSTLVLFSEPAIQSLRERPCAHAEYPLSANNIGAPTSAGTNITGRLY